MKDLISIMRDTGKETFKVKDLVTGEVLEVWWLFGAMFAARGEDLIQTFASGFRERYEHYEEPPVSSISPEDQKKAREKQRNLQNAKLTRELKRTKDLKEKFDKTPIGRRTTKSQELFALNQTPKLTLIKGGKDD